MFHRYVTTKDGKAMDFDRALYMADKNLMAEASDVLPESMGDNTFDKFIQMRMCFATPLDVVQRYYDEYCRLHQEKYGEPFNPDVM